MNECIPNKKSKYNCPTRSSSSHSLNIYIHVPFVLYIIQQPLLTLNKKYKRIGYPTHTGFVIVRETGLWKNLTRLYTWIDVISLPADYGSERTRNIGQICGCK